MGSIDLSVGSVLSLSAFTGALLVQSTGTTAVLLLVPFVGLVCGLFNGALVALGRLPSFLVTLGTLYAFDGLSSTFRAVARYRRSRAAVGDLHG